MHYNAPFFGLFENIFKLIKDDFGEEKAIEYFSKLMAVGLSKSYGSNFEKGDPNSFKNLVSERDLAVGLRVEFPIVSENEIVYRFLDDPFPNLRGLIKYDSLESCYMQFKVDYLLGDNWTYTTEMHIWDGDEYIQHRITKNS